MLTILVVYKTKKAGRSKNQGKEGKKATYSIVQSSRSQR